MGASGAQRGRTGRSLGFHCVCLAGLFIEESLAEDACIEFVADRDEVLAVNIGESEGSDLCLEIRIVLFYDIDGLVLLAELLDQLLAQRLSKSELEVGSLVTEHFL